MGGAWYLHQDVRQLRDDSGEKCCGAVQVSLMSFLIERGVCRILQEGGRLALSLRACLQMRTL